MYFKVVFRKQRKRLLLLAGIYSFAFFLLQKVQTHQLLLFLGVNETFVRSRTKCTVTYANLASIWKVVPGEDRILAQLNFSEVLENTSYQPPKKILLSYRGWGKNDRSSIFRDRHCAVQNCEILNTAPDEQSENLAARVFKEVDLNPRVVKKLVLDRPKYPNEIWIMYALEGPRATPSFKGLNDVINWTATYRHQSTIVTPYGKWVPYEKASLSNGVINRNYAFGKNKLGVAFISNCRASNGRLGYIRKLKEYMPVDVYGNCGELRCAKRDDSCLELLRKNYKFYFAFENANCRDYISEKFFDVALRNDVIPVVMGAHPDDYKRVAPPGSFIHVEDFSGPEELAKYLLHLASNDMEYNKYFRWQNTGSFIDTKFWCRLCAMLWDSAIPTLSVQNMSFWWREDGVCKDSGRWTEPLYN